MANISNVEANDWEEKVLESDQLTLVEFWHHNCPFCKKLNPIIDELAEEYSGKISIARVEVDQNPKTAVRYNIMSIPTLLLFKKGEPLSHIVGFRPKEELKRSLDAALG